MPGPDRCVYCDRAECPRHTEYAWASLHHDRDGSIESALQRALDDCFQNEVNWRNRALVAEKNLAEQVGSSELLKTARRRSAALRAMLAEILYEYDQLPPYWRRRIEAVLKETT